MSDEIRVSRPSQPTMTRQDSMDDNRMNNDRSKMPWLVLAIVVLAIIVLGVLFRDKLFGGSNSVAGVTGKTSGYQSVFLTNGQVYFGRMSNSDGQYLTLKDIYYLQVTTQPALQGSQQSAADQQAAQQLSLVKLGNELHGPVDSMQINRDQVLFFEDMKEDGKVMQAIREYQKNPPAAGALFWVLVLAAGGFFLIFTNSLYHFTVFFHIFEEQYLITVYLH